MKKMSKALIMCNSRIRVAHVLEINAPVAAPTFAPPVPAGVIQNQSSSSLSALEHRLASPGYFSGISIVLVQNEVATLNWDLRRG